jgi:hypothetical protein
MIIRTGAYSLQLTPAKRVAVTLTAARKPAAAVTTITSQLSFSVVAKEAV